jgi:hypothetical protein
MIENPLPDPWHFPREPLARNVVDTLESGIVNAITLFAPRRMGKTQFACTDLAPLAAKNGWLVAYCNLWDDQANPAGAIVATLTAAAEPFRASKKTGKVGIAANLGVVTANAEVTEEVSPQAAPSQLSGAFNGLAQVAVKHAKGKRLLLVVDEIQLAADRKHEPVAASLRTSLERHAGLVKTLFTGSSPEREGFIERAMRGGYAIGDPMVRIWMERVRRGAKLSAPTPHSSLT